MEALQWHTEQRKVADLLGLEYNPRTIDQKGKKALNDSLSKFNLVEIPVINLDNTIIAGNQRCERLAAAGRADELIDVRVPNRMLTETEVKEYAVISNTHAGKFDADMLQTHFEDVLDGIDFEIGEVETFDFEALQTETLEAKEDDYQEENNIVVDVETGDVFELKKGDLTHRLLCGDSTKADDVEKLMNGQKADLGHNDPPYGMKKEKDGVKNDNLNFDDLLEFNKLWIPLQFTVLKENGSFYCWGIDEPLMDIYSHILKPFVKNQQATFRNLITWNKGDAGAGGISFMGKDGLRSFPNGDEKCLFVMLGVQGFNDNKDNFHEGWRPILDYFNEERKKLGWTVAKVVEITGKSSASHYFSESQWMFPTQEHYQSIQEAAQYDAFKKEYDAFKKEYDAFKKEYDALKKEYYATRSYFDNTHDLMTNVWSFKRHKRDGTEGGHATPKPIPLCERVIKSSCPKDGLVLDVFGGSGSTMVAAHQIERNCYMLELTPHYCQVILNRMQHLDSDIQITKNGQPWTNPNTLAK